MLFHLEYTGKLVNEIIKIERFDASWSQLEKTEVQILRQFKEAAMIRSAGASMRIEGSKATDDEVETLIESQNFSRLKEEEQLAVGYFEALDQIINTHKDVYISEENIKGLHKILMDHCVKDEWHRGDYKKESNTTSAESVLATQKSMKKLLAWYHEDNDNPTVVKTALFVYGFLNIRPFQEGNEHLSRLLLTLLLLKNGYSWIQYESLEHEIEKRKNEYYKVLTQAQKLPEKLDEWLSFFLSCLLNMQNQLSHKLTTKANSTIQLAPREKSILAFIENHPGSKSSDVAVKLNIPLSTVKKNLTSMVENKLIFKYGVGAGTNYIAEKSPLKTDLMFRLTDAERKKEFVLMNGSSFLEIKAIILTPLFNWEKPDEWGMKLNKQGLHFKITVYNNRGDSFTSAPYFFDALISLHHQIPKVVLKNPINIPFGIKDKAPNLNEYPIKVEVELLGSGPFEFDAMFVYDEV